MSNFDLDEVWHPTEADKKRLFNIADDVLKELKKANDRQSVENFIKCLSKYKNVLATGGDGFNVIFYNTEPIQDGEYISIMLDLPEGHEGHILFDWGEDRQGFDISDKLRDELSILVDKSGLDVADIDRYGKDGNYDYYDDEDDEYEDDYDEDDDDGDDEDYDSGGFTVEVVNDETIWKELLDSVIANYKLTKPQQAVFDGFIADYPSYKTKAVTLAPGSLTVSGQKSAKDMIYYSIFYFERKVTISIVYKGESFLLKLSKAFTNDFDKLLNSKTKGGTECFYKSL